jgi:hypothetical protein
MKTKLSLTVTSAVLLLLNACGVAVIPGSGTIVKETRDVSNYSQVVFSAPGELTIEQNGREDLVIEADDNLLGYIRTRVQGDVLYIYEEPDIIQLYPSKPIRYILDVAALTHVTLNGSGDIRANELIASNLDFDLNGSGDISVTAIKSQSTTLVLDGSGDYRLGNFMTGQLALSLDGSGDINMQEVVAKTADLGLTGSGDLAMADVIADTLDVKINGSGDSSLSGQVNQEAITIHSSGHWSQVKMSSFLSR